MKGCLFAILAIYPAFAQVEHGSVAVIYFTAEKIIMAADSRGSFTGLPPRDDYCKIAALGREILFVSTGNGAFDSPTPDLIPSWDNWREARGAYERLAVQYSGLRGHVLDLAREWARIVEARWVQLLLRDAPEVIESVPENNVITLALFGGLSARGELEIFQANIDFVPASATHLAASIRSELLSVTGCPLKDFCAIGKTAPFDEFAGLTSERAKAEARTWTPNDDDETAPQYYDIRRAIRFVELTALYESEVRGPVDAVQLSKDGSVDWYARKANCPEN